METEMSQDISELAKAMVKVQAEITGALKGSENPFFKSKYADLTACWNACREPLTNNGLTVIQTTEPNPDGVTVVTLLAHESGQWIRGRLSMIPGKNDAQGIGSCMTYARRYALAAIVGLTQVDDDAENSTFRMSKVAETRTIKAMEAAIDADDHGAIWETWNELEEAEKNHMNSTLDRTRRKRWKDAILAAAATVTNKTDPKLMEPSNV